MPRGGSAHSLLSSSPRAEFSAETGRWQLSQAPTRASTADEGCQTSVARERGPRSQHDPQTRVPHSQGRGSGDSSERDTPVPGTFQKPPSGPGKQLPPRRDGAGSRWAREPTSPPCSHLASGLAADTTCQSTVSLLMTGEGLWPGCEETSPSGPTPTALETRLGAGEAWRASGAGRRCAPRPVAPVTSTRVWNSRVPQG